MNTVFLGTPEFAVPSLQSLFNSQRFKVSGVFTQPDRRAGRGKRLCAPPVKVIANEMGVEVYQPERIRGNAEALETMKKIKPDVAVVVAFGQILPEEFFSIPRLGTINVHASILPAYRGASPVARAVLNGDSVSGVTIMKIDSGMDTGDILSTRETPIPPEATTGEMESALSKIGAELLIDTLVGYEAGDIFPVEQDHARATYAPKLQKEDAVIDWNNPAPAIHNQIRAMNPRPGAITCFRGDDAGLKIWKSEPGKGEPGEGHAPGAIVSWDRQGFLVCCGENTLIRILEVQLTGRGRISGRDLVNGRSVEAGEMLSR